MTKGSDDKAREAIIRRRRRFVIASTMAGIVTSGCENPQPCLNVARPPSGSSTEAPQPCLNVAPPPRDAGAGDADASDADAADAGTSDAGTTPRVCLKIRLPEDAGSPDATKDAGAGSSDKPVKPAPKVCRKFASPPVTKKQ